MFGDSDSFSDYFVKHDEYNEAIPDSFASPETYGLPTLYQECGLDEGGLQPSLEGGEDAQQLNPFR